MSQHHLKGENLKNEIGSKSLVSINLPECRQKEFICNDLEEEYDNHVKFKEKKSLISIAGQLQFFSTNNTVIIAKSDYIKKSDLATNAHCIIFQNYFQKTL